MTLPEAEERIRVMFARARLPEPNVHRLSKDVIARALDTRHDGLMGKALATWLLDGIALSEQIDRAREQRLARQRAARRVQTGARHAPDPDDPDWRAGRIGYQESAQNGRPVSLMVRASEVKQIRAALQELGAVTPEEMLDAIGMTRQQLRDVVRGTRKPTGDAKRQLGALTARVATTRALWARKVACAVWGLIHVHDA